MRPDELVGLLRSVASVADVLEAIDQPWLQGLRGWDLQGWTYEVVPWGVRFRQDDRGRVPRPAILALALPEDLRGLAQQAYAPAPGVTEILMVG